jgi:hypothetical protein
MSQDAKKADSTDARNSCPLCGGDKFTWGMAMGHYPFKFKPDSSGWVAKNTVFGGQIIRARRCDSCGNIQFFAVEQTQGDQSGQT